MSNDTTIEFQESDHIGLLLLKRPETLNALNEQMIREIDQCLDALSSSESIRVLIIAGAGEKGFCSGMDMKESASKLFSASCEQIYRYQSLTSGLICKMRKIPQPIIAAVHGPAAGAGFSFAMAADVRIITPETRFNAAYINIGLGGADLASSYLLPRLIGTGRAHEFLLTGEFMTAEEAVALGMASRMVDRKDLMDTAYEIARKMTSKNPMGLRMTKEAINQNSGAATLEQAMHLENRNQAFLMASMKAGHSAS